MTSSMSRRLRRRQTAGAQRDGLASISEKMAKVIQTGQKVGAVGSQVEEVNRKLEQLAEMTVLLETAIGSLKETQHELACQRFVTLKIFEHLAPKDLELGTFETELRAQFEAESPLEGL